MKSNTTSQFPLPNSNVISYFRHFAMLCSFVTLLIGLIVFLGWVFNITTLKSVVPGFITMKANTAIGFMMSAAILWAVIREQEKSIFVLVMSCGLFLLGSSHLLEYVCGVDLNIDQLLFKDTITASNANPGRMAVPTASIFMLLCIVFIGWRFELSRPRQYLLQSFILIGLIISSIACIGYIFGTPYLAWVGTYGSLAVHTAIAFMFLTLGLLAARPMDGFMINIIADNIGGMMLRRFLPAALIVPLILGFFRLWGEQKGWYGAEFGVALMASASMAVFVALTWVNAHSINTVDEERQRLQGVKEHQEAINRLNKDLQTYTAQLEEANKELEAFSYSVSHDLRAPLRAIDGFTRIVVEERSEQLDAEGRRLLGIVRDNVKKMACLIDGLLDFSRMGRRELRCSQIDMNQLAQSVFEELQQSNPYPNIQFEIAPLPAAYGDGVLLHQVWVNILSNAIKYSRKKPIVHITVSHEDKNGESVYAVKDNGSGFDMKYASKLFNVFQRLHDHTEFEGTGVGLAIVQRILHRHGGKIWAEGAIDQGAAFYFTLPKIE